MTKLRLVFLLLSLQTVAAANAREIDFYKSAVNVLEKQVMIEADWALTQMPLTVTNDHAERSAGGKHDFFSEADYFWPDPKNPEGPYISLDGKTNPANFVAHRKAMIRFSKVIGALASAYKITKNEKYVKHAVLHLRAWFVDKETFMNPNLQFSQAVKGRYTGRNYGIIDTIHLLEVAQGMMVLELSGVFDPVIANDIKKWFAAYNKWLTTSEMGLKEKVVKNNHSTCWLIQVASFAKLCGDEALLDACRTRYKTVLLPNQMANNGSFPLELERTKPYGYAIFNLDAMAIACQILSTPKDNLWDYETADGKSIKKGISFLYPFIKDKNKWTYPADIMFHEFWPVAQPFLIFGAVAYSNSSYFNVWKQLTHYPDNEEVIRNFPIRNPLIWL
jgi:hypothetical protein